MTRQWVIGKGERPTDASLRRSTSCYQNLAPARNAASWDDAGAALDAGPALESATASEGAVAFDP